MKTQLGILTVGLGIGTVVGWMLATRPSPAQPAAATATKSERSTAASRPTAVAGPDEKRVTKRERPEPTEQPDQPKVMTFSSSAGGEMPAEAKEIFAKMEEQRKEARGRRIDERLAALKSRLNLTPDQESKVRALLEASPDMENGSGVLSITKMMGNGTAISGVSAGAAIAGGGSRDGTFDEQLQALLSPAQQEKFTAFQQEQRENRAEIAANREMTQLQQQLTLTPEQKDQTFAALGNIVRNETEQSGNRFDPDAMEAARQARVDALRPILTPEQLKVYEANPTAVFGIPEVTVMPGGMSIRSVGSAVTMPK